MADMPNEFWSGYIALITIVSIAGLAWLVYDIYFRSGRKEEVADQVWDHDLREGTRPAPLWWFWLILALLVFSVVYLLLYPGLGSFRGVLNWSQSSELAAVTESYEQRFGQRRAALREAELDTLVADEEALRSGWHIYNVRCAACHGRDARGQADMFPDLQDGVWQWGGSESALRQTLTAGRQAVMPPWQGALGDDGVVAVAEFVRALADGDADRGEFDDARMQYQTYCSACHGADGAGNPQLGASALNNDVWIYGGSIDAIRTSIASGRTGVMPAFGEQLDATQIRLLIAWLSAGAPIAPDDARAAAN